MVHNTAMLHYLFFDMSLRTECLLLLALVFVLFYEVINGFHDTANVVATVIYTRALQSQLAVVMAAVFNFFGVLFSGLSVAYAIVHMLPENLLLNIDSTHSLAMVFSILFTAIIWNFGTWYFGLPTSSSHTLIGTIIGVGFINALLTGASIINALNLSKVFSIFISLIISPIVGLVIAGGLIVIFRFCWNDVTGKIRIHLTPSEREKQDGIKQPPFYTRIMLILSAIGVAFSHGANDGQKGIGILMLALISIAPAGFAVNMNASSYEIIRTYDAISKIKIYFQQHPMLLKKTTVVEHFILSPYATSNVLCSHLENIINILGYVQSMLIHIENYWQLSEYERGQIRSIILYISDVINETIQLQEMSNSDRQLLKELNNDILSTIEYAPTFIIISIALALGIGTMIGWKRVATTIGEKIGKNDMTYAQGMSAQITAAFSIGLASYTGMPVSTTHVLASSVAGAKIADNSGVQKKTIINILITWVCTLPISMILSGGLYWIMSRLL